MLQKIELKKEYIYITHIYIQRTYEIGNEVEISEFLCDSRYAYEITGHFSCCSTQNGANKTAIFS